MSNEGSGFRSPAVAFGHVVFTMFPSAGGAAVKGPGVVVAVPMEGGKPVSLGECTVGTRLVGGKNVLYGYEPSGRVWRWSSLAMADRTTVETNGVSVRGLVLDGAHSLWLQSSLFGTSATLIAEPGSLAVPPSSDAGLTVRASFPARAIDMAADAKTIFLLLAGGADGGDDGATLVAVQRSDFAPRTLAVLPRVSSLAVGEHDICAAESSTTNDGLGHDRVFVVSRDTGAVRLLASNKTHPTCAAADATGVYVRDYAGSLWRLPTPP